MLSNRKKYGRKVMPVESGTQIIKFTLKEWIPDRCPESSTTDESGGLFYAAGSCGKQKSTIVLSRDNVLHCWKQWFLKAHNDGYITGLPDRY